MSENLKIRVLVRWLQLKISAFFSWALGVSSHRKIEVYLDLSRSATLRDTVYWLQIILGAGIATLGLVLSSPAIIIGAMLISPLMNPIMASGLALASGDLVLGVRSVINLVLSCSAAIGFAILLVVLLPFREMTPEIAARTQPNVLDLLIALFSGAVGSVAISREVKGVMTSVPGVAIAVALMPPLCVVGYGIGLSVVFDEATGWRVASGGGLLFLTNLVAITLMAMLVFIVLRIETGAVLKCAEEWKRTDSESSFFINILKYFPGLEKAQNIHSLSLRLGMILLPLIVILFPLSSAFSQLQQEIVRKQEESRIRQIVTDVWQESFQNKSDGLTRSSVDQLSVSEKDNKLSINLRVFDDAPYTPAEKKEFTRQIAQKLNVPLDSINLKLTEIPTVLVIDALQRATEEKPQPPPTLAELKENLMEKVEVALSDFNLPPPAKILKKEVLTGAREPLLVKVVYLSDEPLNSETEALLLQEVRKSLSSNEAELKMERVPVKIGEIDFNRNQNTLSFLGMMQLDFAGRMMRENADLLLDVAALPPKRQAAEISATRIKAIYDYLESRWQIPAERIQLVTDGTINGKTLVRFEIAEKPQEPI